jgi:hypothetical protein
MIPAAALLVAAATVVGHALGAPIWQLLMADVGIPMFLLGFVWALVRISQPAVYRPAARPVRGVIVHRPDVYRIPSQEALAIRGGRNDAA